MSLDLDRIKKELETLPKYDEQIALQGTKDNLDPFFSLGSYFKDKKGKETDFDTPIFDIPYINSIIKDLNLLFRPLVVLTFFSCREFSKFLLDVAALVFILADKLSL